LFLLLNLKNIVLANSHFFRAIAPIIFVYKKMMGKIGIKELLPIRIHSIYMKTN